MTLMSIPGPVRAAYAISLNGAGDHVGRSAYDSDVSLLQAEAVGADDVDLRRAGAVRRERDLRAGRRPRRRDVDRRIVRQPAEVRAVAVDDVDLRVAVARRREADPRAVRRPRRQEVVAGVLRQLLERALVDVRDEDVRLPAAVRRVGDRAPSGDQVGVMFSDLLDGDAPLILAVVVGDVDLLDAAVLDGAGHPLAVAIRVERELRPRDAAQRALRWWISSAIVCAYRRGFAAEPRVLLAERRLRACAR